MTTTNGAADPPKGRRLDRESHRWLDVASNRRRQPDLRNWFRSADLGASRDSSGFGRHDIGTSELNPGDGSGCLPLAQVAIDQCHDAGGARNRERAYCALGDRQSAEARDHSGDRGPKQNPATGGFTAKAGAGSRPCSRRRLRRRQRLCLRLLHLVGGAQTEHSMAGERRSMVVERPVLWGAGGSHPKARSDHGHGHQ
jgi:hypothetical protein